MVNASGILAIADSHFTLHLLGPDEADISPEGGEPTQEPIPENLVEDFVDEVADMLEEIAGEYSKNKGWERALVFGFIDGVLALADGSWSDLEDSYYADASNPDFEVVDAALDDIVALFDGSRPWDETAKGYIRSAIARAEEDPAASGRFPWNACAHAFVYGAEAGYQYEWKVIVTPSGNLLLTDEECIEEAAIARASGESGSLIDRLFNMMGIDLDGLAAAIGIEDDDDEGKTEDAESR